MNTNTYIAKMKGAENGGLDITDAELRSAIRRINDRLYQLASHGMQESATYKRYESAIANIKVGDVAGYIQLNEKRPGVHLPTQPSKLSQELRREILAIDRHAGTYGREKASAIEYLKDKHGKDYKASEQEIAKASAKLGKIHEFIEENSGIIYAVEKERGDFITGNDGHLSSEKIDRLFNIQREFDEIQEDKKNKAKAESDKAKNNAENLQALNWLKDNSRLW